MYLRRWQYQKQCDMRLIHNIFSKLWDWYLTWEKQRFQLLDASWSFPEFQYLASILKNFDSWKTKCLGSLESTIFYVTNCNRNRMRAMLEKGLKETSILNPSDFGLTPLHITGFLFLQVFGEYQYKFHEFSPIPAILGDDSIFQLSWTPIEPKKFGKTFWNSRMLMPFMPINH